MVFAVSGAVQASWLSRLPALAGNLRLDLRQLGFALFALGIGSLVSMPVTGRLCRRFGTRQVVAAATLLACVSLVGARPGDLDRRTVARAARLRPRLRRLGRGDEPARGRGRGGHGRQPDADVPRLLERRQRGRCGTGCVGGMGTAADIDAVHARRDRRARGCAGWPCEASPTCGTGGRPAAVPARCWRCAGCCCSGCSRSAG